MQGVPFLQSMIRQILANCLLLALLPNVGLGLTMPLLRRSSLHSERLDGLELGRVSGRVPAEEEAAGGGEGDPASGNAQPLAFSR